MPAWGRWECVKLSCTDHRSAYPHMSARLTATVCPEMGCMHDTTASNHASPQSEQPRVFCQCRDLSSHLGRQHWRYHEVSRQLHLALHVRRQHTPLMMVHGHAGGLVKVVVKGDLLVALSGARPSQCLLRHVLLAPAPDLLPEEPAGLLLLQRGSLRLDHALHGGAWSRPAAAQGPHLMLLLLLLLGWLLMQPWLRANRRLVVQPPSWRARRRPAAQQIQLLLLLLLLGAHVGVCRLPKGAELGLLVGPGGRGGCRVRPPLLQAQYNCQVVACTRHVQL